jgi:hypothetical protein
MDHFGGEEATGDHGSEGVLRGGAEPMSAKSPPLEKGKRSSRGNRSGNKVSND